jgi:hypothetical protein
MLLEGEYMRYYALYNENNKLVAIGTGYGGVEITKEEYDVLFTEIRIKADLVYKVYNGEATLEDVPMAWREEIKRRVETLQKSALVEKLYNGEITIYDVPTEWRAEVQMRVDERIAQEVNA